VAYHILKQHWFCVVPLLPAAIMIGIHEAFGLSNEMGGHLVGRRYATPFELGFNYAMVMLFYAGVGGYLAQSILIANRGVMWLVAKLVLLAIGWAGLLAFLGR